MKSEFAIPEMKYRLAKYLLRQMVREGILDRTQYVVLRDRLLDVYKPVIGELERGVTDDY